MSDLSSAFRKEVETFMASWRMPATEFGLLAMNDGHFVRQLKQGRNVSLGTVEKVRQFMRDYNGKEDDQAAA